MTKEEYLQQCNVTSADDLADEQILRYFIEGHGGLINRASAMMVKKGRAFGCDIDRAKSLSMLRQAFTEDKNFEIHFIEGEGVVIDDNYPSGGYFEYKLR